MSTATLAPVRQPKARSLAIEGHATGWIALLGRALYVAIFLVSVPGHFSQGVIGYAANQGVPMANVLVPASGVLALIGALSVLLGYRARIGASLLIAFLVPVTIAMHAFWAVKDPMMAQMQMAMFMKNVSLIGTALLLTQIGSGPLSLDRRGASGDGGTRSRS